MQKYIILEILFFYILICFKLVQGEDFPVSQSQLEVVMYDERDIEFQMKDRSNLTVVIRPTSTLPLKVYKNENKVPTSLVNVTLPLIASSYYYDQQVVEIFRFFLQDQKLGNISSDLKILINRYIKEWDDLIHDPETEDLFTFHDNPFPEFESPYVKLPKEIEHIFKLVRMNVRVQSELPIICRLLSEFNCTSLLEEIIKTEIKSLKYFDSASTNHIAFETLKLSDMYFSSPVGLIPEDILSQIPIKDLITISMSANEEEYLREPLKWLNLSHKLFIQKYFADFDSEPKNSVTQPVAESRTNETGSVNDQNINSILETFADNLWTEFDRDLGRIYIDILRNHFSFKHDYALNASDYGTSFDNLFPKLLTEVSVDEQSRQDHPKKEFKTNENNMTKMAHMTSMPNMADMINIPSYKELCNGIDFRKPKELSKLSCRYDHLDTHWYSLMPVKVEELYEDPKILFFHDVLSESMISTLLQLALPILLPDDGYAESQVYDSLNKTSEQNSRVRSSFVAFLNHTIHGKLKEFTRISQYLSGLDTLSMGSSEDLQANSYKPGGHYVAHMDSFRLTKYPPGATKEEKEKQFNEQFPFGDRVATILYYLNEVEGGRTAFTDLGISASPEKGGALMWFSLFPSGKEDQRTKHAGCPVIKGIKSVVNKWIRYNAQIFRRPCLLERKYSAEYEED